MKQSYLAGMTKNILPISINPLKRLNAKFNENKEICKNSAAETIMFIGHHGFDGAGGGGSTDDARSPV